VKQALVVDDSKVVRSVATRIMQGLGFEVREAENGQIALNACKAAMPEVILLDWNMPVMDGMEFMKHIQGVAGSEKVKIIFCTTENEVSKIQAAVTSGAHEYVMKPFDTDIIQNKLQQLGLI
jgi:two-component system, chemotaxis family, chemotaxis protein CheY